MPREKQRGPVETPLEPDTLERGGFSLERAGVTVRRQGHGTFLKRALITATIMAAAATPVAMWHFSGSKAPVDQPAATSTDQGLSGAGLTQKRLELKRREAKLRLLEARRGGGEVSQMQLRNPVDDAGNFVTPEVRYKQLVKKGLSTGVQDADEVARDAAEMEAYMELFGKKKTAKLDWEIDAELGAR